jgi:hypothetical protein
MNLKINLLLVFVMFFITNSFSQSASVKEGSVSYLSSQFVYVKFDNTDLIQSGDTLYVKKNKSFLPKLIVKFKSSVSASCEKLDNTDFKVGDKIFAMIKQSSNDLLTISDSSNTDTNKIQITEIQNPEPQINTTVVDNKIPGGNLFNGRYSVQSYSNISNYDNGNDYQSWRHSLRIDYEKIGSSDLSFYTYSIFSYRTSEWSRVTNNYFNALRVYDLHLKYDFNSYNQVWLGRFLSPRLTNLSTVDGLLFESNLKLFTVGIIAGTRPDWKDFTFNPKLIEYGAYIFRSDSFAYGYMENTISFVQQTNNSKTDRRFLYLQHSNKSIRNFNLFASTEIDLYKRESGIAKNDFNFTSIFLSASYHPLREILFNLSYDARKNVIYYETFKSLSDSIIENETRQGFRFRTNIRPFRYFGVSLFAGYRFRKSDVKPSKNFGGSIYYSFIPVIESGINFSYNKLISNYVDGDVYSVNLNKSIPEFNSDFNVGFRKTNYKFPVSQNSFDENAFLLDYNLNLFKQINLSISYEGAFESKRTTSRFLVGLSTRF